MDSFQQYLYTTSFKIEYMIPADEIYNILESLKTLRQERGYTKSRFDGVNKRILALAKDYHWHKDELLELVEEKDKFFDYKTIHKEINVMKSLLKFISKLLKKKEFVGELADVEQFKKAIRFNELKLKALDGRNKECLKTKKVFEKVIKVENNEFEKYLGEWDSAQAKVAYVDRLEDGLEKKVMLEQARKFPESVKRKSGVWKTATAYAVAAMIGFGAITADYSVKGGISFGGGEAVAGEVVHDKAFYDRLSERAEKMNDKKDYKSVIQLLNQYKNNTTHAGLLNSLAYANGRIGNIDIAISLFEKAIKLNPHFPAPYYNLGGIYSYIKKDKTKGIKYFKLYIQNQGEKIEKAKTHIKKLSR